MEIKKMNIGSGEITAPSFILGTFAFGGGTSWQDTTEDDEELIEQLRNAYDLGVRGLDTAPVYGVGRSERIVGRAIEGCREDYYIQTKCSLNWRDTEGTFTYNRDGKTVYNNFSKDALLKDIDESLYRLGTDHIDMMIVHRCPPIEQMGVVMEALEGAKERGMIRGIGLSNVAQTADPEGAIRAFSGYGQLDLVQEGGSLLNRQYAEKTAGICKELGITYQAYSALEKGALAGKRIENVTSWTNDNRAKYKWFQSENIPSLNRLNDALKVIAGRYDCSVAVLCLAWMRTLGDNVSIMTGARKLEHLKDSIKCLSVDLADEDIREMNRLSDDLNASI